MAIDFGASSSNGWTEEQQKLLSVIPHVTGSLSILGSAFIIYDVASDRKKWSSTYHRLLFAMGIYDFLSSFASSLSTIPMPEDSGILSFGNVATCTAQGMFVNLNIASPLYNFSLSVYFLLTVSFRWSKQDVKKKVETWLHLIPFVWAFITTLVVLIQDGFNDSSLWCWINSSPKGCSSNPDVECERCPHCEYYRWFFFFVPLWLAAIGTIIVMYLLVRNVKKTERNAERWRPAGVMKRFRQSIVKTSNKSAKALSTSLKKVRHSLALDQSSKSANSITNAIKIAQQSLDIDDSSKSVKDINTPSASLKSLKAIDKSPISLDNSAKSMTMMDSTSKSLKAIDESSTSFDNSAKSVTIMDPSMNSLKAIDEPSSTIGIGKESKESDEGEIFFSGNDIKNDKDIESSGETRDASSKSGALGYDHKIPLKGADTSTKSLDSKSMEKSSTSNRDNSSDSTACHNLNSAESGNIEKSSGFSSKFRSSKFRISKFGSSRFGSVFRSKKFDAEERKGRRKAHKMSRMVTRQAFLYCFVFWITWLPGTTNRILQVSTGHSYFWVMFLHVIFTPMQGFLNFFVYIDIRFRKWWKEKQKQRLKAKEARTLKARFGQQYNPSIHISVIDQHEDTDEIGEDDL